MRIAVIIPALNEEITIAKVVADFKRELPEAEIIVFDNNSTDNTAKLARKAGARVIHYKKRGKGNVMQGAFEIIDSGIYVIVDGDDTYPAEAVHKLLKPVLENKADMAVGCRMGNFRKEEKTLLHNIGNHFILAMLKFCFPTGIQDMLSGFRVMTRGLVKNLNLLSPGFSIEAELTIKAIEEDYRIVEVPIDYRPRPKGSRSKLDSFSDGMYILTTIMSLFRDYRPMQFFMLMSMVPFALTVGFGVNIVVELLRTGSIGRIATFIMALFSLIMTFMLLFIGFLASSVHQSRRELLHMLKKIRNSV